MTKHKVGTREDWLAARFDLLEAEKALTRRSDEVARQRQALPWVRVDKEYRFETETGAATLADLFAGNSQLLVYHFMFGPEYEAGCASCSAIADGFDGFAVHLANHDVTLMAVSYAPIDAIRAFKRRMGWTFDWYSSEGDFNYDFAVSFTPEEIKAGHRNYNFGTSGFGGEEAPGISVFYRDEAGNIFHTYSCFARGLDMMNAAYHYLDLTPLGRHEEGLPYPMDWVRLRDQYQPAVSEAACCVPPPTREDEVVSSSGIRQF
jgi:predicted dithiol-disulfide oxidoreductase (DUF899 family)